MAQKLYEETNIQAIADAIREKNGLTTTYKTSEMAAAIAAIPAGGGGNEPTDEELVIYGDCYRAFYGGKWGWIIDRYGNRVSTRDISNADYMFYQCTWESLPFEFNFATSDVKVDNMFAGMQNLKEVPKFNNCKPSSTRSMFAQCYSLREIPEDFVTWFDWSKIDGETGKYAGGMSGMFYSCYSLRRAPVEIFAHGNPNINGSYASVTEAFSNCHALDEVIDFPITNINTAVTSNILDRTVSECNRLKNFTFATPNGQPYVLNWKSQTLDLTNYVGYTVSYQDRITIYNSGITTDKRVYNDATYQALKDDPDWYTDEFKYSRYNHDSAVATINSLPDTSAYGANTIKFTGVAGSATDGGAINTLTEEEIAVAAAKGWTVTLV